MLLGVLRMPINYVGGPLSPVAQLVSRARQAADRIESDAAKIDDLLAALTACEHELHAVLRSISTNSMHFDGDEFHERLALSRAAIARATGGVP
jgi:hypothetical protein